MEYEWKITIENTKENTKNIFQSNNLKFDSSYEKYRGDICKIEFYEGEEVNSQSRFMLAIYNFKNAAKKWALGQEEKKNVK